MFLQVAPEYLLAVNFYGVLNKSELYNHVTRLYNPLQVYITTLVYLLKQCEVKRFNLFYFKVAGVEEDLLWCHLSPLEASRVLQTGYEVGGGAHRELLRNASSRKFWSNIHQYDFQLRKGSIFTWCLRVLFLKKKNGQHKHHIYIESYLATQLSGHYC